MQQRNITTYSLRMDMRIEWSRTVICSAISRAEKVSMFF